MNRQSAPAPVEIVDGCEAGRIPDHVFASDRPLLLKGLVAHWPAIGHCSDSLSATTDYLSRFWSGTPVTVYVGEPDIDGRFFYTDDFTSFNFKSGTAPLPVVLQKLAEEQGKRSGQAIYVGSSSVDRWLPGFREDNDLELPSDDALMSFWLGNRTRVSAHFDFPDNVACVVAGRRRFTMFPPEQIANLYVGPLDRTPSGQPISLVDVTRPDLERFPRFAQALDAAYACELDPGDAVFIPGMWWHHVESLSSFNLLINYWWTNSPQAMGSPTSALMHAILALRDLPARQRDAWKNLFEHYVFEADESVYAHIPEAGRGCLAPLDEASAKQLRAELLNRLNR